MLLQLTHGNISVLGGIENRKRVIICRTVIVYRIYLARRCVVGHVCGYIVIGRVLISIAVYFSGSKIHTVIDKLVYIAVKILAIAAVEIAVGTRARDRTVSAHLGKSMQKGCSTI